MKTDKKEFIVRAHREVACDSYKKEIEKYWPELFPEEFKEGDWLVPKEHSNYMVRYFCEERIKGSFKSSEILGYPYLGHDNWDKKSFKKATKKEVEKFLIEEAKNRGLIGCVTVEKPDNYTGGKRVWDIEADYYVYQEDEDALIAMPSSDEIYNSGKWAKVVEETPKDIQEIVDKYGKENIKKWL